MSKKYGIYQPLEVITAAAKATMCGLPFMVYQSGDWLEKHPRFDKDIFVQSDTAGVRLAS